MIFLIHTVCLCRAGCVCAQIFTVFEDVTEQVGLHLKTPADLNLQATWIDYDQDGWVDLFVGGKLWRNITGEKFVLQEIPPQMRTACIWGDFNNDGYPDAYCYAARTLFINNHGRSFVQAKEKLRWNNAAVSNSIGAAWGDFNSDGFLDLFVSGYENEDRTVISDDVVMINRRGKYLESVKAETGSPARGVVMCDFDQDGDLDIYISNYRLSPNTLLINDGNGGFKNKAAEYHVLSTERGWQGGHSTGACWADFDNDGFFDLFSVNFSHRGEQWGRDGIQPESDFFRNKGRSGGFRFEDKGTCGVFWQESYVSATTGDFDNDGFLDVYMSTAYPRDHGVLFRNNGDWTFSDVTGTANLGEIKETYQTAVADFDNDGHLDLFSGGRLFRNQGTSHQWLKVRLTGSGNVPQLAIGSQVYLSDGNRIYSRQVESAVGHLNQNDFIMHFGLGENPSFPLKLKVIWTDRSVQTMQIINANQLIIIKKQEK
ncbi:MAG: CRTAC1 family protein [Kiritimatiellales bacterium]